MFVVEVIKNGGGVIDAFSSRSRPEALAQKGMFMMMYPDANVIMEYIS
jgi:hypothetical protein